MVFLGRKKRPPLGYRCTALLAAGLILALAVFAASPALHAWLHGHELAKSSNGAGAIGKAGSESLPQPADHDDDDDGCVVSLFAIGVLAAAYFYLRQLFWGKIRTLVRVEHRVPLYRSPRFLHPPLCGPPIS